MALLDLQAQYMALIVEALEAGGYACLHRPKLAGNGRIYVTRSETDVSTVAVVSYDFDEDRVALKVERTDLDGPDTDPLLYASTYLDGIGNLWVKLGAKLNERLLVSYPPPPWA